MMHGLVFLVCVVIGVLMIHNDLMGEKVGTNLVTKHLDYKMYEVLF